MSDLIPLSKAREFIPGAPCMETLYRWATSGARGRKLVTVLRGGRRFVSRAAVEAFINSDPQPIQRAAEEAVAHAG